MHVSYDELSIDIKTEHDGDALVFRLRGSLDIATSPSVRAALSEAADEGKHDIIVDLTELQFIDSTGLGALIGGHRRAVENGGRLSLVARAGAILRLLNITGLIRVFSVYPDRQAALEDRERVVSLP